MYDHAAVVSFHAVLKGFVTTSLCCVSNMFCAKNVVNTLGTSKVGVEVIVANKLIH